MSDVKRFEFVGKSVVEILPGTTCGGTPFVLASDYDALTARVAELEAKLGQAQHAYTVTAMELDRYKNPGQTIRLSAADGGSQG